MLVCLKAIGTFVLGSLMIVTGFTLSDKSLTPLPQTPVIPPADRRLAEENYRLSQRCAALERDNAILKLNVETLMRFAVIPPAREQVAGDKIPPQQLPVRPAGLVAIPTPEELGVNP